LAGIGVRVLTSRGDDLTDSDDEMRVAMRQIAGVFSQLEKTRLVKKLVGARSRKREALRQAGHASPKVEGRRSHAEARPEVVAVAKRLRTASPKDGKRRSFRQIAAELAGLGHLNERGKPYNAASIKAMVDGPRPGGPMRSDEN
jgi:hypothetical protein